MYKGLLTKLAAIVFAFSLSAVQAQDQHNSHGHSASDSTQVHQADHGTPAQHSNTKHSQLTNGTNHGHSNAHNPCGPHDKPFNASENAIHHIADANAIHIYGDLYFHLPCFLYAPKSGWTILSSTAKFRPHDHGNGTVAQDGYVLVHGNILRITDESFPKGEQPIQCVYSEVVKDVKGKDKEVFYAMAGGKAYLLDKKSSWDGGLMGGGITSWYDFSITRNIFSMLLSCLLLFLGFRSVASSMQKREGQAPTGLQNFLEPLVEFVRDDIAIPNLGAHRAEKFLPFLLTIFFFILGLNLLGQIPFFPGGGNVTGALTITMVLALVVFLVTNLNGNKHYWGHIFNMPGVPKIVLSIITPVEVLGVFIKPFTLLLRLFANITAGHIVILSFVSVIFIFGKSGNSIPGTAVGALISVPLTLFAMALELLVAFLQAYVFTLLAAVYLSDATSEAHH